MVFGRFALLGLFAFFVGCASDPIARGDSTFLQAVAFETRNDIDRAIEQYTLAIEQYKTVSASQKGYENVPSALASAYAARGSLYAKQKRMNEALADADQFIKLKPNESGGYISRAARYQAAGNCDAALADASKAYQLKPELDMLEHRANMTAACGRLEKAVEDYNELIRAAGDQRPRYFCNRGRIYAALGKKEDAAQDFTEGCNAKENECCQQLDTPGR